MNLLIIWCILLYGAETKVEGDLKLDDSEVIYLRLHASEEKIYCHGSQKRIPEKISTPSTSSDSITENNTFLTDGTENSIMVGGEGGDINPYVLFGGILAALVVINLVCIGVYCLLRNRKPSIETTTNASNRKETNNDNSLYNYIDIDDAQVTISSNHNYGQLPVTHTNPNLISKTVDKAPYPLYHELEIEDKNLANEKSSDYDHIVGNKFPLRDATPVYNHDNYDHITSTSLQRVINNPYNHIGDDIQVSDYSRIKAKGHNPPATKSGGSEQTYDPYNHLKK